MKKLKHIKKLDQYGCVLACLAMITGKSYFEIREAVHKSVPRFKNTWSNSQVIGLLSLEMINFLKLEFNISGKHIKFRSLRALKRHCILLILPLDGNITLGHGVVFDAKARCILDPDCKLSDLKDYNIYCCIEIQ